MKMLTRAVVTLGLLSGLTACASETVTEFFRDETPREGYERALSEAGLMDTGLGEAWIEAGLTAMANPVETSFPYEEAGVFRAAEPTALGYEINLERGQLVRFDLELQDRGDARLFLEVFAYPEDGSLRPRPVVYGDSVNTSFTFEPRDGGRFLVRLQPELLVDARYRLTIRADGSLAFPVSGRGMGAIQSVFGDPREGGRRTHHGVDIFAPRGTPVVAVSDGTVNRVDTTNLGGLVVWLRDQARGQNVYYAHLNEQLVRNGQRVTRGDTLGTVGNTGNARTTPPHLHFGIYQRGRGPVNPWFHLERIPQTLASSGAQEDAIGSWASVRGDGIRLRGAPSLRSEVRSELASEAPLEVLAAVGDWYRVRQPDGAQGFVFYRSLRTMTEAVRTVTLAEATTVWRDPMEVAPIDALPANATVPVRGEVGGLLYVESPNGGPGWLRSQD